ncbi:HET domain-containing protein [Microdochium nivale]|nr:HET domain-containing protein [Microdochium nivale]
MRLLEIDHMGGIGFTPDLPETVLPPYAILSHTWDHGHEVTYDDMLAGTGHSKRGWRKIRFCERQAPQDSLSHFWVDSCCIDKANHGEMHGALGAMFAWYRDAHVCYVYLTDVKTTAESDLLRSRWWTRGWTLQELLAPRDVRFFARGGQYLGDKATLEDVIRRRTGIPAAALRGAPFDSFTIEEQLSWLGNRQTTYPEDLYNCLVGILGDSLARRYEGARRRAFYSVGR